jgi:hypothetical protein
MWTIVRFGLHREGDYRPAFDILAHAGFQLHRSRDAAEGEAFPGAVVADVFQDPAVICRAVFQGLHEAGLGPVGVSAAHVDVNPAPARGEGRGRTRTLARG